MAAGSPTTDSRRQRLTRERIVAVALDKIERDGHESVSLRSLARELDVTAPAIYDHVENKAEVLGAVATHGYLELIESFDVDGEGAIDRCRQRARAYIAFAQRRPELFRVMFMYRPAAVNVESDNELSAATATFNRGLDDIAEAIADGDLVDRDPVKLNLTLWAAIHGVAQVALMAPPVAHQVADDVIDAMFNGLRP